MQEPKYRRSLNEGQIRVLELLYKFRFGSSELIAESFRKKGGVFMYKRLSILSDQGLIGKKHDSSFRIVGKPAAYYLTPDGARTLEKFQNKNLEIKRLYKEKEKSDLFIEHCFDLFKFRNILHNSFNSIKFFTKSELSNFEYFPNNLPDAYFRIGQDDEIRQYFVDFYYDAPKQPFFVASRKIKNYVEYASSGDWDITNTSFPIILCICESQRLQKRLLKKISSEQSNGWGLGASFAITSKSALESNAPDIWQLVNDPSQTVSLTDVS